MNDPYGLGNSNPGNHGGYAPPPPQGQPGYGQPNHSHGQPDWSHGQPDWGGYAPPPPGPQGYVSYGQGAAPPNIYAPPAMAANHELRQLEDNSQLWLLVAAAGFWVGFGWITGPLAWYNASQIRSKYRALGHHPCSSANWARGLGIASTVIYTGAVAIIMLAIIAAVGAVAL